MRTRPFTPDEIRALRGALARASEDEHVTCPACGSAVSARAVEPAPEVPYVRSRVRVHCPGCGRSGAVDRRAGPSG